MTPTVSIVMPVKNGIRALEACLRSLAALDPAPAELVLVDNGSTDGSAAVLEAFARRAPSVKVLTEPRPGASCARNAGIRASRGDLVAFVDADCTADPAWLAYLLKPFTDPRVGGVAGRVVPATPTTLCERFCGQYTLASPAEASLHHEWTPRAGGFPTANLAVRRAALDQIGGFDEAVRLYGEDYDLCARLYAHQWAIAYAPEAVVHHHHRTTLRGLTRQSFGFGRSHAYLVRRHLSRTLWLELPGAGRPLRLPGLRAWVDLASADKKLLTGLLLGVLYAPLWGLVPLYLIWLVQAAHRRAAGVGARVSVATAAGLATLLLWKSAAMTAGRWWGSVRHGAICF